jgi:ribosome biogenesis GTPase / thiamine phosphate phosphatase
VPELATLGWDDGWSAAFAEQNDGGLVPGRVSVQHRGAWDVLTEDGEVRARLPGRVRRDADSVSDLPVVGDWVALEPSSGREPAAIRAVLPRRTKFSRLAAHDPGSDVTREQVVAANVDIVFLVASLVDDLSPRRFERYLTLAWESGARPVILLTKADLEPDPDPAVASVRAIAGEDVPIHAISVRTGAGLDEVRGHLGPGTTAALLGPSGVGKSTLVNALAGEDVMSTGAVREDGTGRHTTTRRQLVILPGDGLIVDNPGMRELHLWLAADGLEEAFEDVIELEARCKFSDCRHQGEPGCAIQEALENGSLDPERWQSYLALRQELGELEERLARKERSRARRGRPGAGAP